MASLPMPLHSHQARLPVEWYRRNGGRIGSVRDGCFPSSVILYFSVVGALIKQPYYLGLGVGPLAGLPFGGGSGEAVAEAVVLEHAVKLRSRDDLCLNRNKVRY